MKKSLTIFLQVAVALVGIAALVFMLWEPHIEGRNANATFFQIYFKDAFLAYMYIASISFFVAIYKTFKLLGDIGANKLYSQNSVKSLRTIKNCGQTLVGFIVAAEAYLFIVKPGDDIAGGVFMGLLIIAASGIVAIVAKAFEKRVQNSLEIKTV